MKRLNPETSQPFSRGDTREDGYLFFTYVKTQIKSNGFYAEKWLSPKAAKKQFYAIDVHSRQWQSRSFQRRRKILDNIKLASGCELCGYAEHPAALDFDHIDPKTKKFNIGTNYVTASAESLYDEVMKCRVLCANCHRIKSYDDYKSI